MNNYIIVLWGMNRQVRETRYVEYVADSNAISNVQDLIEGVSKSDTCFWQLFRVQAKEGGDRFWLKYIAEGTI